MKQLFAPWRHAWVTSPDARADDPQTAEGTGDDDVSSSPGCLFCRTWASADDAGNLVVRRGERAFVMLNRYPYNGGHLLIAPVRHLSALETLEAVERAEMMELAARSLTILGELYQADGYNLGVNQGRAAGAGIPGHVHLHVVPRWSGDTNFMTSVGEARVISTDLARTRDELAERFAGPSGGAPRERPSG